MSDDALVSNLRLLSRLQFTPSACAKLWSRLLFQPLASAQAWADWTILVPTDVAAPLAPEAVRKLDFSDVQVTLWNPLPAPEGDWTAWPTAERLLFWRSQSRKTLMPAWNFYATARDLLSFREDREIASRDRHGRFPIEASPRHAAGVTGVPFLNEGLALFLAAANALAENAEDLTQREEDLLPVRLALSHDCDELSGGGVLTHAIRAARFLLPLLRGRKPPFRALAAIPENALHPRRYYLDNMFGMFDMERAYGMRSASYILNGDGGRLGARTPDRVNALFCRTVPQGWPVGMHYNYDTVGNAAKFAAQREQIGRWTGGAVTKGRAHYLRFGPATDFPFLAQQGIRYDESVGWPYDASYRCGVAGPFIPLAPDGSRLCDIVEMPLVMMDTAIPAADGKSDSFTTMHRHLQRFGGVLSILIHPGVFFSPEVPACDGLYQKMLSTAYRAGATSLLPDDIMALAAMP
jgi:hypothetical protein